MDCLHSLLEDIKIATSLIVINFQLKIGLKIQVFFNWKLLILQGTHKIVNEIHMLRHG